MNTDTLYFTRNKWLSGRGTKILYLAVCLGIFGAVGTSMSAQQAKEQAAVEQQTAVKLAQDVVVECRDGGFAVAHVEICRTARQIVVGSADSAAALGSR